MSTTKERDNDMSTCRTCCKPIHAPYRVYDVHGHVVQGCIASDHDGHLQGFSASNSWHVRKQAVLWRAAVKKSGILGMQS